MKQDILFLNNRDIVNLKIGLAEVRREIERVLGEHGQGKVEMPPKPGIHPQKNSFIHAMPAFIPSIDGAGVKWVSGFPENHQFGLPQIMGLLILNDTKTGRPLAIMDARWLTGVRTAAVTAITAKYCARNTSETMGLIGSGIQGRFHALMLKEVLPQLKEIKVYDINKEAIKTFTEFVHDRTEIRVVFVKNQKEAIIDSDVVITAAQRVEKPFIEFSWLNKGVFAVGLESGRAWGATILQMDKFITDDWKQTKYFASQGSFPGGLPNTYTELGKIIIKEREGRMSPDENIIACNVGLAIEDIAVGKVIYEKALEKGIGTWLL